MAKRKIRPQTKRKTGEKKHQGKRIMVTLPPELVVRLDAQMSIKTRDALIAKMLTEHLNELDEQAEEVRQRQEQERRAEKRRQTVSTVFRQLGDTFLP